MFINNEGELAQIAVYVRKTRALGEVPVSRKQYWAVMVEIKRQIK